MTPGTISPKVVISTLIAAATYLLTQQVLELPGWAVVLCMLVLVGLGGHQAPVGSTEPNTHPHSDDALNRVLTDRGHTLPPEGSEKVA